MGKVLAKLNQEIIATDKANYYREQYQSFMTGPEWRNVEMAQEFAEHLEKNNSLFSFPYFRQIWDLWKIFYQSYNAARKYNSRREIWSSEYMLMDGFVVLFTTFELFPKALISLVLNLFIKKNNPSEMQKHIAQFYREYADKLDTVPFYNHDYKQARADLKKAYKECRNKTWGDWWSWTLVSTELFARHWISKPLRYWFGSSTPDKTEIIVKYKAENAKNADEAIHTFKNALNNMEGEMKVEMPAVKPDLKGEPQAKDKNPDKTYTSVYARLSIPRYVACQNVYRDLEESGIHVKKIAGQDRVQVKCQINAVTPEALQRLQQELIQSSTLATALYDYGDRIHNTRRFCMFDVKAKDLGQALKQFDAVTGTQVKLIHNF